VVPLVKTDTAMQRSVSDRRTSKGLLVGDASGMVREPMPPDGEGLRRADHPVAPEGH
jgi:hypothetical protein